MNIPFVNIDVSTAKNAKINFGVHKPLIGPSVLRMEKGPTWRNLVIPIAPVKMEIPYDAKNQDSPPKPLKTAHFLLSG